MGYLGAVLTEIELWSSLIQSARAATGCSAALACRCLLEQAHLQFSVSTLDMDFQKRSTKNHEEQRTEPVPTFIGADYKNTQFKA